MKIFRGREDRTGPAAAWRSRLDAVAGRLLSTLLRAQDGQRITLAAIADERGLPARRLHAAARTLMAAGLVVRVKHEDGDGRWATDLFVFDTPVTAEELEAIRARHADAVTITTEPAHAPGTQPASVPADDTSRRPTGSAPLRADVELVTVAAVRKVLASLPAQLTALLPSPLPAAIQSAAKTSLAAGRTPEELCLRVLRRWSKHYADKVASIRKPVGVAIALLRPGICPDPRCEDGAILDSGTACPRCAERREDHRAMAAEQSATTGPPPSVSRDTPAPAPTPTPPPYRSLGLPVAVDVEANAAGIARVRAALSAAKDARPCPNLPLNTARRP